MEALLTGLGRLATLGGEYAAADAQRRQQILEQLDQEYRGWRGAVAGLPQVLRTNDAAADAAAAALPSAAPAPSPLSALTDEQLRAELARRGTP